LDCPLFRKYAFLIIVVLWLFGGRGAFAQSCVVDGPRYNLIADTVSWSMKIASGRSCVRGVGFRNVKFESLKLVSPPQVGQVALLGPGFRYTAKAGFEGQDSFTVVISGEVNKIRGSSTIHVAVSVTGPPREPAIRGVVNPPAAARPQARGRPAIDNNVPLPVGAALQPCPLFDWSKGAPPPMWPPFDRTKLYCPPSPFKPSNPPVGCTCPEQ
jgi:hypothetical protein